MTTDVATAAGRPSAGFVFGREPSGRAAPHASAPGTGGQASATRWRAQVTATRPLECDLWVPRSDDHERARSVGAALWLVPQGYALHFEVITRDLALATRAATAKWARLHELCNLPDWPLTAIAVNACEETAADPIADFAPPSAGARHAVSPQPPRPGSHLRTVAARAYHPHLAQPQPE